jgi:hypothetical protein
MKSRRHPLLMAVLVGKYFERNSKYFHTLHTALDYKAACRAGNIFQVATPAVGLSHNILPG